MLLAVAAACSSETIEVPGKTVVVKEEVIKTVEVPGETVVKEVIKEVQVPGETVVVKEEVVKEVMVPGETVVVEKVVTETVEVPGETVTVEVVKTVEVPGETVVVEKEVVKTVEVPGETVVVEKEVVKTVEVPGETIVVEKVVEKEVIKTVAGPERVVVREVPGKNYVTDPSNGKVYSAPQYGGTLTHTTQYNYVGSLDTIDYHIGGFIVSGVLEKLTIADWAIDRDEYPFVGGYQLPTYAMRGALAESWEQPDDTTIIFHIRRGVHWHNKAPMNGRELTAKDVEYTFHRMLGLGSGFTEPSTAPGQLQTLPFESITATDKWTVVFKMKEPYLTAPIHIQDSNISFIYPPEVIEQYGGMNDWRNLVGTGPFELTDRVEGSSWTWTKNPDYWGHDAKFPENRLPYIDELRMLIIPEEETRVAAIRSGHIDFIGWQGFSPINNIDLAESLKQTNPELVMYPWAERSANAFALNTSRPPFDDVRVRKAMQMALDLETMNATFFKGLGDTIPKGTVGMPGYFIPYDEWPQEVKDGFAYNPEGVEKLLDEAGYPRGSDGIRFTVTLNYGGDVGYKELSASYWSDIGVDVKLKMTTGTEHHALVRERSHDMITTVLGIKADPFYAVSFAHSEDVDNKPAVNDPVYDAMYEAAEDATSFEQLKEMIIEMDMYAIERFWRIWGPEVPGFTVTQPWVTGYSGEGGLGGMQTQTIFARLWIDSQLKEAMGH